MTLVIKVIIKNVYGNDVIYPACEIAFKFCELLAQKTLTRQNIEIIKSMGYTVEVVLPTLKL
jgi:hypothetical protein